MKDNLGMSTDQKRDVANQLAHVLADTFTLYLKTHHFHWNVEGPRFFALHNLFEEQYREMWDAVDEIAERIRALGEKAPGTFDQFRDLSSIAHGTGAPSADDMVRELAEGHEGMARTLRAALKSADNVGDDVTVDLLTNRLGSHEKNAWMLRSSLA